MLAERAGAPEDVARAVEVAVEGDDPVEPIEHLLPPGDGRVDVAREQAGVADVLGHGLAWLREY